MLAVVVDDCVRELSRPAEASGWRIAKAKAALSECDCSRCLKTFRQVLEITDFNALVPLTGEESVPVEGDFANLTPRLREDSLLALPTAPLCKPDCRGLAAKAPARDSRVRDPSTPGPSAVKSPWDALEQLKLK